MIADESPSTLSRIPQISSTVEMVQAIPVIDISTLPCPAYPTTDNEQLPAGKTPFTARALERSSWETFRPERPSLWLSPTDTSFEGLAKVPKTTLGHAMPPGVAPGRCAYEKGQTGVSVEVESQCMREYRRSESVHSKASKRIDQLSTAVQDLLDD